VPCKLGIISGLNFNLIVLGCRIRYLFERLVQDISKICPGTIIYEWGGLNLPAVAFPCGGNEQVPDPPISEMIGERMSDTVSEFRICEIPACENTFRSIPNQRHCNYKHQQNI